MAIVTKTRTYGTNDTLTAAYYNADRDEIIAGVNSITNAQIANGAAIDYSKLNLTGLVRNADIKSDAAIDASKIADTAITQTATQTMSNKTITKPVIEGSVQSSTALTGTTPTIDCSNRGIFSITLEGNTTFAVSNVTVNQFFIVEVKQGSGTSYTTSFSGSGFTTVTWVTPGGVAPIQSVTSNGITTYGFRCVSSGVFTAYLVGTN